MKPFEKAPPKAEAQVESPLAPASPMKKKKKRFLSLDAVKADIAKKYPPKAE